MQLLWVIISLLILIGNEAKVEYTFGYKLINGNLKIDVHHSSFPYAIIEQAV